MYCDAHIVVLHNPVYYYQARAQGRIEQFKPPIKLISTAVAQARQ